MSDLHDSLKDLLILQERQSAFRRPDISLSDQPEPVFDPPGTYQGPESALDLHKNRIVTCLHAVQPDDLCKPCDVTLALEVQTAFGRFGEFAEEVRWGHPVVLPEQTVSAPLYAIPRTHQFSSFVSLRKGRSVPETNVSTSMTYSTFRSWARQSHQARPLPAGLPRPKTRAPGRCNPSDAGTRTLQT